MSIAEDILDGSQCSHCGVCFVEEHGSPVLCDDCFAEQSMELLTGEIEVWDVIEKHYHKEM